MGIEIEYPLEFASSGWIVYFVTPGNRLHDLPDVAFVHGR